MKVRVGEAVRLAGLYPKVCGAKTFRFSGWLQGHWVIHNAWHTFFHVTRLTVTRFLPLNVGRVFYHPLWWLTLSYINNCGSHHLLGLLWESLFVVFFMAISVTCGQEVTGSGEECKLFTCEPLGFQLQTVFSIVPLHRWSKVIQWNDIFY